MNFKIWKSIARHTHLAAHPTIKHILTVMAIHTDENGECFPKLDTLMAETGRGQRTVENALSCLEKAGYFTVIERGLGRGNPSTYRLHPTQGGDLQPFVNAIRGRTQALNDSINTANRAQEKPQTVRPYPSQIPQTVPTNAANRAQEKPQTVRPYIKDEVPVQEIPIRSTARARTAHPHAHSFSEDNSVIATTTAPQPTTTAQPTATPMPARPLGLQPAPQSEIELALCEIGGVTNSDRPALRDAEQWPIALDVVQRTGASADDLRAFRAEWFATPTVSGQPKRSLFLSNVATYLPQWMQQQKAAQHNATWQQVNPNAHFSGDSDGFNQPRFSNTEPGYIAGNGPFAGNATPLGAAPRIGLREQRRNSRQRFYREYAERFGSEMGRGAE